MDVSLSINSNPLNITPYWIGGTGIINITGGSGGSANVYGNGTISITVLDAIGRPIINTLPVSDISNLAYTSFSSAPGGMGIVVNFQPANTSLDQNGNPGCTYAFGFSLISTERD